MRCGESFYNKLADCNEAVQKQAVMSVNIVMETESV